MTQTEPTTKLQELDQIVIRFAGDSGDGMQLTGDQFTRTSALMGNDLATFPDFPAEIRAPAGTLPGVSAFQIQFPRARHPHAGRRSRRAGGDEPGGAQGATSGRSSRRRILIVNSAKFKATDLKKARYDVEPAGRRLAGRPARDRGRPGAADARGARGVAARHADERPLQEHLRAGHPLLAVPSRARADVRVPAQEVRGQAGDRRGQRARAAGRLHLRRRQRRSSRARYRGRAGAVHAPGTYRNIMGNQSRCLGLVAASKQAKLPIFLGSLSDHAGERHPAPAVGIQAASAS